MIGELIWGLVGFGELMVLDGVVCVPDEDVFVKGGELT